MFYPTPPPEQDDIEAVVHRTARRVVRYLEKRGVIAPATAPGDGEITVVVDESVADKDPLLGRLLAAACAGAAPAGPAYRRVPVRLGGGRGAEPRAMGKLCAQELGFNLHAARRVAGEDKEGRESLCRYILRPPIANQRVHELPGNLVRLDFKRPWSDGTNSVTLDAVAFIARLAAIVPPPKRHVVRYFGVLSSHSKLRSQVVPPPPATAPEVATAEAEVAAKPKVRNSGRRSKYIPHRELLKHTFGVDLLCQKCQGPLRLIALVKSEATIKKILGAMGLPTEGPQRARARPPPQEDRGTDGGDTWSN